MRFRATQKKLDQQEDSSFLNFAQFNWEESAKSYTIYPQLLVAFVVTSCSFTFRPTSEFLTASGVRYKGSEIEVHVESQST
jgi:hypothetical protein